MKIKLKTLYSFLLLLSVWTISFPACNPRGDNTLQQEHANTYLTEEEMEGYREWVKDQQAYTKDYQHLLAKADGRLELLEGKMDNLSLQKQAMAREDIKHLETWRIALENNLQKLEQANEQNWTQLNQEVEMAADSVTFSLEKIDKNVGYW
jgi:hypothetical protein